jgi:hypothetical protein
MGEWLEQIELGEGGRLRVEQQSGAVQVKGVPGRGATVRARWAGDAPVEERLRIQHRPGVLDVEVLPEERTWFGLRGEQNPVDLVIEVPVGTFCAVEIGSGPLEVTGTAAPVHVDSGSGPVRLHQVGGVHLDGGSGEVLIEQVDGEVHVDIGSGRLFVRQVHGNLAIDSASGSKVLEEIVGAIHLENGSGSLEVRRVSGPELLIDSGSGAVRLEELDVERLVLDAGSGKIWVDMTSIAPDGHYEIEAGSGGVTLHLPPDANLAFDLSSNSGSISVDGLPLTVSHRERRECSGRIGRGGAHLEISTGSGSIQLLPRQESGARRTEPNEEAQVIAAEVEMAVPGDAPTLREILEMVADGRLSPAEADLLIARLKGESVK